jgi:hypothetical protein
MTDSSSGSSQSQTASNDSSGPSASEAAPSASTLTDRWAPGGRILVNGPFEPASATQTFLLGVFALIATFIIFQVIVSPVVMIGILVLTGGTGALSTVGNDMQALIDTYARELLVTNAISQWLAFAIPTLLLARLHASNIYAFIRLRKTSILANGLALAGMVAFLPVAQFLAGVNQKLPIPEFARQLDEQSMQLIAKVLETDFSLAFGLVMLAVTPAICEELIFRGYAQRQFERVGGATVAIVLSGVIFGLYHLRLTQVLPLTAIGLYLAYLTWRTGSIWPAILAHFANNAIIVAFSELSSDADPSSATVAEGMDVPAYSVVLGFLAFCGIIYALHTFVRPDEESGLRVTEDNEAGEVGKNASETNL